jgi:hypothetical protein
VREAEASAKHVTLALTDTGALAVTIPGAPPHSVVLPPNAIGMDYLLGILRERTGKPQFIASPGAPTQADLAALARASKRKPTNCTKREMTLEDLEF